MSAQTPNDPGAPGTPQAPELDPQLLEILRCPSCHARLTLSGQSLDCQGCGLRYPIRDGIPVLLVDEASKPA